MLIKLHDLITAFDLKIRGVIHIGAHVGEELEDYLRAGIRRTIWVEANIRAYQQLVMKILKIPGQSAFCFAAHEIDDMVVDFFVTNNMESSSLLEMEDHLREHPNVSVVGVTKVGTRRMDTAMAQYGFDTALFNFLNLDIQGAELLALKGMPDTLRHIDYIYSEVNERHLYKGCCLVQELDNYLKQFGFERVETRMTRHGWGDAFYMKTTSLPKGAGLP